MSDRLFDGRPFRILTIVDCHTREALASAARTNFRAYQVIDELDRLARARGEPRSIRVDNGPEFASRLALSRLLGCCAKMDDVSVFHAAAVTAFHLFIASVRNCRIVLREIRWR